jgi:hypothetical protein
MGTLQLADRQTRPTEVLDVTSLTAEEFQELVPPFEAVFQAHMTCLRRTEKTLGTSVDTRIRRPCSHVRGSTMPRVHYPQVSTTPRLHFS